MSTRWSGTDAPRGDEYDARWRRLAAQGQNVHGEADLVEWLLRRFGGQRVLDAGCGTGRVAIELAARGFEVVGVDVDRAMLDAARAKAPALAWVERDLAALGDPVGGSDALGGVQFDLVVTAGNVMIFLEPGTEAAVVAALCGRLREGGLLVAGFQLTPGRLALADYDHHAAQSGLELVERWSTWDRAPFTDGDYAVSVHQVISA
jgi:SAM-dependent methyltransferase